ncbi:MAG: ABC transporter permease [Mesorhizobium sp.]|uniref:ABC transporter permease n=1 Tax=Mesorhizobium sp. TaxID=1871066 RepID=UPI000FE906B0|nr:ABC transporter permease [Mesorhizobium sp.]RWI50270.1 MAG: ABC transporter permease [Mesorhizobium sp.]
MTSALAWLVVRRLIYGIPLVAVIAVLTFILVRMAPGDPAMLLAGDAPTPQFLAQIRAEYGLDKPLLHQLLIYLSQFAQGDLGTSIYYQRPVLDMILQHFPVTWLLVGASMALASMVGCVAAVQAARYRNRSADAFVSASALVGFSLPTFWLGQLLVLFFAVHLGWFPTGGMGSVRYDYTGFAYVLDVMWHMVLPILTLLLFEVALVARYTRTAMLEALDKDFIVVAYAKGASTSRVLWRHAFPNALGTTVTVIGLEFGILLAGAVVTEIIYGWPGIGRLFVDAVYRRDFPLLTGCFLFTSTVVVLVNIVTDVVVAILDPRATR